MSIQLAVVDDHHLFLEGIKSILETIPDFEVVFTASSGEELFTNIAEREVDIILLDLEMDPMNGMEAFQQLKNTYPAVKVIILTMHSQPELITRLMKDGVHGYLLKDTRKSEFETAIRQVYKEGLYFGDQVSLALLKTIRSKSPKKPQLGSNVTLTSREMEVLELICQEYTTQEIADKLFLSSKTVEGHRKNLLGKLGVRNTAGLVKKAIEKGFVH